jgi:hypothetical protein
MNNQQNILERRGLQHGVFEKGFERNAKTGEIIYTGRQTIVRYTPPPAKPTKPACPPCLPCTPNGRRVSLKKSRKSRKSRKVRKN